MNIAVIGVGGIGAWYVARLAEGGHAVTAVARAEHLGALQRDGLTLLHDEQPFRGPVDACDIHALVARDPRGCDLVILLTKATATAELAPALAAWGGADGPPVLSLQNGVDNETTLVEQLGAERVIGGFSVLLSGHVETPGVVRCVGRGQSWLGVWPHDAGGAAAINERIAVIAEMLEACGLQPRVSPDIRREMWRKLVLNNGVNPLSALLGWDTLRLSHDLEVAPLVRALMDETVAAGRADGVALDDSDAQAMFDLIAGFPPVKTSMLVDLERGRPLELDAIAGAVLARAERHGIDVPYTRTVKTLLEARLRS